VIRGVAPRNDPSRRAMTRRAREIKVISRDTQDPTHLDRQRRREMI